AHRARRRRPHPHRPEDHLRPQSRRATRPTSMRSTGFLAALGMTLVAPALFAGSQVTAKKAALATTSPVTTQLGLRILQNGGNAADAAVAIGFALGVVQPHAAGLGGGGFLAYFDAKTKGVWALGFRQAAPGRAKPRLF